AAFFFSSRRRHTRFSRDWSSDVCSSDLDVAAAYAAFERGEYATSLDLARRILSTRPAYADMRNLAGISLALLGDSGAALEELDEIGRASCRERVAIRGGDVRVKKEGGAQ